MTKDEAIEKLVKISMEGEPGKLTTTMCEALGISFESFLRYSQLDKESQARVMRDLASALMISKNGHCSQ